MCGFSFCPLPHDDIEMTPLNYESLRIKSKYENVINFLYYNQKNSHVIRDQMANEC